MRAKRQKPVAAAMVVLAGALAAGCQTSATAPSAVAHAQTVIVKAAAPSDIYALVARQAKACWLDPADPVLPNHVFHAEAAPDGAGARIAIHERAPDGGRGLRAYAIAFEGRGGDTRVVSENHRVAYAVSQKMGADVGRWVQGDPACEAAGARGPSGPRRGSF